MLGRLVAAEGYDRDQRVLMGAIHGLGAGVAGELAVFISRTRQTPLLLLVAGIDHGRRALARGTRAGCGEREAQERRKASIRPARFP